MKRLLSITSVAILLSFGAAQAHTHLESSMPADQAVLASSPMEIMLHFSEATRLTALTIQKEGETEQKKIATPHAGASAAVTIPLEPLSPGKYTVNWRAVGGDNHVMSGALQFSVQAKASTQAHGAH